MLLKKQVIFFNVQGLNFDKFLKQTKKDNIDLYFVKRTQHNLFTVGVYNYQKEKFLSIAAKLNLIATIESRTRLLSVKETIKKNIAIFMCAVLLIFTVGVLNCFVFKIDVEGIETLSKEEILFVLNSNNINVGKPKSKYNLASIEKVLQNSIDKVSLASAIIRGNTLIVSINEKIDNSQYVYDFKPILAPYDMVITDIKLKSGTTVKQKNQTVKKGETIILPYIEYKDGAQLSVEAEAEISGYIELSTTYYYMENHQEQFLTGKCYQVVEYSLFDKTWGCGKNTKNNIPFSNYETKHQTSYIFNNFLVPIKKTITTYSQVMQKQVYKPFNYQIEQNLIEENKKVLYNKLSNEIKAENIKFSTTTNFVDNMYLVTTYLKADITI